MGPWVSPILLDPPQIHRRSPDLFLLHGYLLPSLITLGPFEPRAGLSCSHCSSIPPAVQGGARRTRTRHLPPPLWSDPYFCLFFRYSSEASAQFPRERCVISDPCVSSQQKKPKKHNNNPPPQQPPQPPTPPPPHPPQTPNHTPTPIFPHVVSLFFPP